MFDIGFWELVVVGVVGLLVLGPERLPVAIRTVSKLFKTVRDTANSVKAELSQELRMEELHRDLKKAEQFDIKHLSPELKESIDQLKEAAASVTRPYEKKALPKPEPELSFEPEAAADGELHREVAAAADIEPEQPQLTPRPDATSSPSAVQDKT